MLDLTMLLDVKNLNTLYYNQQTQSFKVCDNVSFSLNKNEMIGILGESGCGKTSLAYSLMNLIPRHSGKIESGEIIFNSENIVHFSEKELRSIRGNKISYIFQEPLAFFNPSLTLEKQIIEPLIIHHQISKEDARSKAIQILKQLHIQEPEHRLKNYSFEISGGQLQRMMIAMALITNPQIIIADEPITSLDVTTQNETLNLFLKLKQEFETSFIIISHDLPLVSKIADRLLVMYAGKIIESGNAESIINSPSHPYTQILLQSIQYHKTWETLPFIKGQPPKLYDKPNGCHFHPRCPYSMNQCKQKFPPLKFINESHHTHCWLIK